MPRTILTYSEWPHRFEMTTFAGDTIEANTHKRAKSATNCLKAVTGFVELLDK